MKSRLLELSATIALMTLIGCSSRSTSTAKPDPTVTLPLSSPISPAPASEAAPAATPTVVEAIATSTQPSTPLADPFELISQESLFGYMEALTKIQPYSGWRNSATEGEVEALDLVAERLGEFEFLSQLGLALERQNFRVFLSTELWETRLHLTMNGEEVEVPADGLRGPRDDIDQALRFDSDGVLNDSAGDPVIVAGPVVMIRDVDEIHALSRADLHDRVVFLDYTVVDRVLQGVEQATKIASDLLDKEPAGLVLVTSFSNAPDESHGTFVGDLSAFTGVEEAPMPPTLYVRLEDLVSAKITSWDELAQIEAVRMTWDADVFSPGTSGNLMARIPGVDSSRAVILGAHIDSPNAPGAMDDGSGSAVLLEVARVINNAQLQPPTDIYLVWFGSEEIGLYGSYHFVSTHQELLDRSLAMLQIDMLARPVDGIDAYLNLVTWSYGRLGDDRLTWADYLDEVADLQQIELFPINYYGVESDNTAFAGFDVPNANLIYMDAPAMFGLGSIHYACHIHDPYDTMELASEVGDVLEQMAQVALMAALETGRESPVLRVAPHPDRRAVFVASHTEAVHMAPTTFTDLGMALAWEGFDVDMVAYGQEITPADLADADLVIALPVLDYPSSDGDLDLYDEAWSQAEIAALEAYAAEGGFLVLTNSAHRLKYSNRMYEPNEDWSDANALAERFGVSYVDGPLAAATSKTQGNSPLVDGVGTLALAEGNGLPIELIRGDTLALIGNEAVAALVSHGSGEILALADVSILSTDGGDPVNLAFWLNLARYARSR